MNKPLIILTMAIAWMGACVAQAAPQGESVKVNRELYVPFEDLDLVLQGDPNRVYLTRDEYEQLVKDARQKPQVAKPTDVTLLQANYRGSLVDGRIALSGDLTFEVLNSEGVFLVPLEITGLGLQSARHNDQAAPLARSDNQAAQLVLSGEGKYELSLVMTAAAHVDAAQQSFSFSLPTQTATRFELSVAGNVDLKSGAAVISRRYREDDDSTDFELLLAPGTTNLVLSVNNRQRQQDQLTSAQSVLVSEVTQGYERLHATISYLVMRGAVETLLLELPDGFDTTDVDTTLLARWEQVTSDEGLPQLRVVLRQPVTDRVVLRVIANRSPRPEEDWLEALGNWTFPQLKPLGVASQVSVLGLLVEERLQCRQFATADLLPLDATVLTRAIPESVLNAEPGAPAIRQVAAYYAPQVDFALSAEVFRPDAEVRVASSQILLIGDQGLQLSGTFVVSPFAEEIYELNLVVPGEWQLDQLVDQQGNSLDYERRLTSDGQNRYLIRLGAGVAAGNKTAFDFLLRTTPSGWLQEWQNQTLTFPILSLQGATEVGGALAVQTIDDLDVTPGEFTGLIPILENEKAELGIGDIPSSLAYRFDSPEYLLPLNVVRTPAVQTARCLSFLKIDPDNLSAHYEITYDVSRAKVRSVSFALPLDSPAEVQVQTYPVNLVSEVTRDDTADQRLWTVKLQEPFIGELRVIVDYGQPRSDTDSATVELPLIQATNVSLQSGLFAVEGDPELEIQIKTDGRRVDVGELTTDTYAIGRRLVGSFSYVGSEVQASAEVNTRDAYGLPPAIIQRAELVSKISVSGKTQSVARYDLLSKASLLELSLPEGSRLWTIFLDGEATKPQRDGDRLLLGLPTQTQLTLRRLQIVYETETSQLGLTGQIELTAPRLAVRDLDDEQPVEIPQADLEWQVLLPSGHRIQWSDGTMSSAPLPTNRWSIIKLAGWMGGFLGGGGGLVTAKEMSQMSVDSAAPSMMYAEEAKSDESFEFGSRGAEMAESEAPVDRLSQFESSDEADTDSIDPPIVANSLTDPFADAEQAGEGAAQAPNAPAQQPMAGESGQQAASGGIEIQQALNQVWALEGVSSLRIDLQATDGPATTFHSLGESPRLTLATINDNSLAAAALSAGLLAILLGIALWRRSLASKVRWIALLLIVGCVPLVVTTRLDGVAIFFDSLFLAGCLLIPIYLAIGFAVWIWRGCCAVCCGVGSPAHDRTRGSIITSSLAGLGVVALLSGNLGAQEKPGSVVDLSAIEHLLQQLEGPIAVPNDAIVVPYDPETQPARSPDQKLLVPYAEYVRLWNLTHPDQQLDSGPAAPLQIALASATYSMRLEGEKALSLRGVIEIYAYDDQPHVVPLRLHEAVVVKASLDGRPARLQFVNPAPVQQENAQAAQPTVEAGRELLLLVEGKGKHSLELDLQVGLERQGAWQIVNAVLPTAAAQTLEVTIPQPQTEVTQQGLFDVTSRETSQGDELWTTTLGPSGQLGLRWRTKLSQAQIDQALTATSRSIFDIREDSRRLTWNVTLDFGRSTRDTFSFDAPGDYLLEDVVGTNVRSFSSREEADRQTIDVTLLKPVQGSEQLTLSFSRQANDSAQSVSEVDVPVIQVRDAALESGEVLIRRSPRLEAQVVLSDGISRYEENDALNRLAQQADVRDAAILAPTPFQAFRFVKPPYVLRLKVQPLPSSPVVTTRSALRVSEREVTLDSSISVEPQGQPIYELRLDLPPNLEPIRVGSGELDWALVPQDEGQQLTIRYLNGQAQPFQVPVLFRVNEPYVVDAAGNSSLNMPVLKVQDVQSQRGEVIVIPDPDTDVRLENLDACEASPVTMGPGWLVPQQRQLAKATLRYSSVPYQATLRLVPRVAQVSSRSVTNVLITSRSIEETVLIDFEIQQAGIRQLSMLVPEYLGQGLVSAKLLKQKTVEPATDANGQPIAGWLRLTLLLQDDVRGAYSVLLQGDRLLAGADYTVQLPVVETGRSIRRLVAVENAGRDEIVIDADRISGLEALSPQQQAWRELTGVLGDTISQAFVATDNSRQTQLVFETLERLQVERAGARIGLAQTTLIVDESGGYRAIVDFRVSNADEPFLELELPTGAQLWTVSVAGEPGKAIQAQAGSAERVRIPLVKTAEGEGDYPVQVKYGGKIDLQKLGQVVSFPLLRSMNINIELSQVRLMLPESINWLDFNGTMRLVEEESDLAEGFQSYLNKRIQEAAQALSSGSNSYSKVRAAVNLRQSRQLMEENLSKMSSDSAQNNNELQQLMFRNDALLADAEQQVQTELSEAGSGVSDNREKLNEAWRKQDVERSKNLVSGLDSNFESAYQQPQGNSQEQQSYNLEWFAQNSLQTEVLDQSESAPAKPGGEPAGKDASRLRLYDNTLEGGNSKGQSLEDDLKSAELNRFNTQQQGQYEQQRQGGAKKEADQENLREYRAQLERSGPDNVGAGRRRLPRGEQSGQLPESGAGGMMDGEGRAGGGIGGGFGGYPPSSGPQPGVSGAPANGMLGGLAGPMAYGAPQPNDDFGLAVLGDTGFVSLDVELPERGRVFRFTTPRGDMEITARPVAYNLKGRGNRIVLLVALLLAIWLFTRAFVLKLVGIASRSLAFAILLTLVGLFSLVVGPLPVLGLIGLVVGVGLIIRWSVVHVMNRDVSPQS